MASPLDSIAFRDRARAAEEFERLGSAMPERVRARIERLLASAPDPGIALASLERLRRESPAAFDRISSSPAGLQYLIATFSYSRFLADEVLRNPEAVLQLAGSGSLYRALSPEEYGDRLVERLGTTGSRGSLALE